MRRIQTIVVACIALIGVMAIPALASVDQSPRAVTLPNVTCPEAELFFEVIWIGSGSSLAGHDLEGNIVGVAKSLYFTDSDGNPFEAAFDRPGKGLDSVTVWCFWPDEGSPTGFVGGDILFKASLRN